MKLEITRLRSNCNAIWGGRRHRGHSHLPFTVDPTELPQQQVTKWRCSSSDNWWLYPLQASGQCHCCQACSAWPPEWVHRPGQGKVSPHCQTLWLRFPGRACSETEQSLQPAVWQPPFSLPDRFYSLWEIQQPLVHICSKKAPFSCHVSGDCQVGERGGGGGGAHVSMHLWVGWHFVLKY